MKQEKVMKILIWETPEEEREALIALGVSEMWFKEWISFPNLHVDVAGIPNSDDLRDLGLRLPTKKEGTYIRKIFELLGIEKNIWTRTPIECGVSFEYGVVSHENRWISSGSILLIVEE